MYVNWLRKTRISEAPIVLVQIYRSSSLDSPLLGAYFFENLVINYETERQKKVLRVPQKVNSHEQCCKPSSTEWEQGEGVLGPVPTACGLASPPQQKY